MNAIDRLSECTIAGVSIRGPSHTVFFRYSPKNSYCIKTTSISFLSPPFHPCHPSGLISPSIIRAINQSVFHLRFIMLNKSRFFGPAGRSCLFTLKVDLCDPQPMVQFARLSVALDGGIKKRERRGGGRERGTCKVD